MELMMNQMTEEKTPNTVSRIEVNSKLLPLHCPIPGSSLWNSHPKVYLPIKENGGFAKCPYCGTDYILKD
jgi:uncharacterized Zn-finger protein